MPENTEGINMKILISDPISESAKEELKRHGEVTEDINRTDYDILIVRSRTKVDRDMIDSAKNLKLVIRAGVGLDNIDVEYCRKKGIEVENTGAAPSVSVAELVFAHMLSLARSMFRATESLKRGEWLKDEFVGIELAGKTLGIIGYGRIGREVAKRARSFGMKVVVHDPFIKEADAELTDLDTLLRESDFVTLHVPLTPETKNLINREKISEMKDGAFLINTSRGKVVDEEALYDALKSGKLAGAGLDVFSREPPEGSELITLDNVSLTPHIGSNTREAKARIGKIIVEVVREFVNR